MEFPSPSVLPKALDKALAKNPDAQIFVLSEYTLDGPVPDSLKEWCREHARFLVVGGKDPVGTNDYYNTAFVVGTNGEIVFHQAKSVPIQFFKDGLAGPEAGSLEFALGQNRHLHLLRPELHARHRPAGGAGGAAVDRADDGSWKTGAGTSTSFTRGSRPCARRNTASRFSAWPVPAFRKRSPAEEMSSRKLLFPAAWTFSRRNSGCRCEARFRWTGCWRRCAPASRPSSC